MYATTYNLIFENGVIDSSKQPTSNEILQALGNKYRVCTGAIITSSLFGAVICGVVKKADYSALQNDTIYAWLNSNNGQINQISVTIQRQQEYVSQTE